MSDLQVVLGQDAGLAVPDVLSALGANIVDVTQTPTTAGRVDPITGRRLAPFTGTDDPKLGAREQLDVIAADLANAPRSLQVALGPSEVGHPCGRRIAYGLLGYPVLNPDDGWLPGIGTAVHEQVACAFRGVNARLRAETGEERYLVEHPVSVRTPAGEQLHDLYGDHPAPLGGVQRVVAGHLDLFDVALGEVTDWKVVGKTTLTKAKRGQIDVGYRAQQALYGYGLQLQGYDVRRLRIHYLPRNDPNLRTASVAWTEDVTPDELAAAAGKVLTRFDVIADGVEQLGPAVLAQLDPVEANCASCDFHVRNSPDPVAGCAGPSAVTERQDRQVARQLDGLIP